jgi:hypothetical protein
MRLFKLHSEKPKGANPDGDGAQDAHRWTCWLYRNIDGLPPSRETSRWMFEWDGSWNDIYVKNTTADDWNAFFSLISSNWKHRYTREGEPDKLPEEWFAEMPLGSHSLDINLDAITVTCVHFDREEIELFIDPREIKSEKEFSTLLEFMSTISRKLRKDIYMGAENIRTNPCLHVQYIRA